MDGGNPVNPHTVVAIPGDGIGPEVTHAVQRLLVAAEAPIEWEEHQAGLAALEKSDDVLPEATLEAIREHGVALKGPCTTPVGEGFSSVNVQLRKQLNLYAAVRPVRNFEGIETRFTDVDLVIVRENTEGLYSGIENEVTEGVVTSLKVATERACTRIARWGFAYARERGFKSVTVFHKANIMKLSDGMFIRCARSVHEEAPADFPALLDEEVRKSIGQHFRSIGYAYVTLDLEGFRSGSMNEVLTSDTKKRATSRAKL